MGITTGVKPHVALRTKAKEASGITMADGDGREVSILG